jgi:DNA-directed RNA polymerase specialized sigma24 family protein
MDIAGVTGPSETITTDVWSPTEFQEWLETDLESNLALKKWALAAKRLLFDLPCEPQDLVAEAVYRILNGQRALNRNHAIAANFHGVMRSIASSWHKQRKRKPEISVDELRTGDGEEVNFDQIYEFDSGVATSPEKNMMFDQELKKVLDLFSDREEAQMVVLGRCDGLRGVDLANFAGLESKAFASVSKLVTRRLTEYRGMNHD